nr:armadillo repeat-containing protein 7-like [Dermatophagoides farinae]
MHVRRRQRKRKQSSKHHDEPKFFDPERASYLQELYDEFKTTKCQDARRQTLANLANFAYNPENYGHLISSMSIHCSFLQSINSADDFIAIISIKGLCNMAMHPIVAELIGKNESLMKILSCIECRKHLIDFIINGLLLLIIVIKEMNQPIDEQIRIRLKTMMTTINNEIDDVRVRNYCHLLLMDNVDDNKLC